MEMSVSKISIFLRNTAFGLNIGRCHAQDFQYPDNIFVPLCEFELYKIFSIDAVSGHSTNYDRR